MSRHPTLLSGRSYRRSPAKRFASFLWTGLWHHPSLCRGRRGDHPQRTIMRLSGGAPSRLVRVRWWAQPLYLSLPNLDQSWLTRYRKAGWRRRSNNTGRYLFGSVHADSHSGHRRHSDRHGVDGTNTLSSCDFGPTLVGIMFASGSSGTLKDVAFRNHNISNGSGGYCGAGTPVSANGATSVTITDSSIRNFDSEGTGLACRRGFMLFGACARLDFGHCSRVQLLPLFPGCQNRFQNHQRQHDQLLVSGSTMVSQPGEAR